MPLLSSNRDTKTEKQGAPTRKDTIFKMKFCYDLSGREISFSWANEKSEPTFRRAKLLHDFWKHKKQHLLMMHHFLSQLYFQLNHKWRGWRHRILCFATMAGFQAICVECMAGHSTLPPVWSAVPATPWNPWRGLGGIHFCFPDLFVCFTLAAGKRLFPCQVHYHYIKCSQLHWVEHSTARRREKACKVYN